MASVLYGSAVGGEFCNTAQLNPMKLEETIKCFDKELWEEVVAEEHRKLLNIKYLSQ